MGHNTREDLSAMKLGLDGYLVTDWLLNPDGFDVDLVKHGSMADFLKFVEDLPKCENAAESEGTDATANAVEADAAKGAGVSTRENAAEGADADAKATTGRDA